MYADEYINGYIERKTNGYYDGHLKIEGVDISPIEGVYFDKDGKQYLWLKRKPIMEYDFDTLKFKTRKRKPYWECYLEKQINDNVVSYKGEFFFLRFRYTISGTWDNVFGMDKKRLNLFIDRKPMEEQTILKRLNEKNRQDNEKR